MPLLLAQLNNDKDDVEVAAAALSVLTLLVQSSGPDAPLVLSALSEASVQQVITFTFAHVAQSNDSAINVRHFDPIYYNSKKKQRKNK